MAAAIRHLHRRRIRVEEVEILRLGAAPTVAQVPDQRIGVPQRAIRDQIFEGALIGAASIAPDMDITDVDAVGGGDHARAGLQAAKEHCVRMNRRRRYAERHGRPAGVAANRKGDRGANLAAERGHGPERETVHRKDLIADKKTRLMSWRVLDDPSDDSAAPIVLVRECADARIGDLARWKDAIQAATAQRTDEYVGENSSSYSSNGFYAASAVYSAAVPTPLCLEPGNTVGAPLE